MIYHCHCDRHGKLPHVSLIQHYGHLHYPYHSHLVHSITYWMILIISMNMLSYQVQVSFGILRHIESRETYVPSTINTTSTTPAMTLGKRQREEMNTNWKRGKGGK